MEHHLNRSDTMRTKEAYWRNPSEAQAVADRVREKYPEVRLVHYLRGWAVQVKKGGDYLTIDGTPSLQTQNQPTPTAP